MVQRARGRPGGRALGGDRHDEARRPALDQDAGSERRRVQRGTGRRQVARLVRRPARREPCDRLSPGIGPGPPG
ncbi:hypothetical protein FRIGORI9N_70013 [Frigoribacterium sp. 9N]|nr:hypothetical protein FRIGORI9N_70013 [Frigoribacterium sp. 9N]